MTTRFGKEFAKLSREEKIRHGRELAESYRDEVLIPRGCCGFIWRIGGEPTGSVACELPRLHHGPHVNGSLRCEIRGARDQGGDPQ